MESYKTDACYLFYEQINENVNTKHRKSESTHFSQIILKSYLLDIPHKHPPIIKNNNIFNKYTLQSYLYALFKFCHIIVGSPLRLPSLAENPHACLGLCRLLTTYAVFMHFVLIALRRFPRMTRNRRQFISAF